LRHSCLHIRLHLLMLVWRLLLWCVLNERLLLWRRSLIVALLLLVVALLVHLLLLPLPQQRRSGCQEVLQTVEIQSTSSSRRTRSRTRRSTHVLLVLRCILHRQCILHPILHPHVGRLLIMRHALHGRRIVHAHRCCLLVWHAMLLRRLLLLLLLLLYIHIHLYICIYIHMKMCIYTCKYMYTHIHIYVCIYTNINTYSSIRGTNSHKVRELLDLQQRMTIDMTYIYKCIYTYIAAAFNM